MIAARACSKFILEKSGTLTISRVFETLAFTVPPVCTSSPAFGDDSSTNPPGVSDVMYSGSSLIWNFESSRRALASLIPTMLIIDMVFWSFCSCRESFRLLK